MNGLSSARRFDAFYRAEESNDRCETGYALIASPRDADRNIQANLRLPRQRGTNLENDAPPRLPIPKNATTDAKSPTHRKPSPAMRQPSGSRDYKPPLGPRPAEFASRRLVYKRVRSSKLTVNQIDLTSLLRSLSTQLGANLVCCSDKRALPWTGGSEADFYIRHTPVS